MPDSSPTSHFRRALNLSFTDFPPSQMIACGSQLRYLASVPTQSQEELAQRISEFFYSSFTPPGTLDSELALVRVYRTVSEPYLPQVMRDRIPAGAPDRLRSLMLLGTSGDEAAWNMRSASRGHQFIPFMDEASLRAAPMLAGLFHSFGLELADIVSARVSPKLLNQDNALFNVFHIEHAVDSSVIPAQDEFVKPYGVRSVVGFGGAFPDGELFAVIAFSKVRISQEVAERFNTLALQTMIAMLGHLELPLLAESSNPNPFDERSSADLDAFKVRALNQLLEEQERRIYEQSVRIERQNMHMTHILSNVQQGFVLLDATGHIKSEHSRALAEWFSAPPAGGFVWDWLAQASHPLADALRHALSAEAWQGERVVNLGSFYIQSALLKAELIHAQDSRSEAIMILVLTDMTTLEEAEQAKLARKKAESANQAKSKLLANMSHELRTPLNAILGYTELMLEEIELGEQDAQTFAEELEQVKTSGYHLLHLISSILDLSKIEANMVELYFDKFSLGDMCNEAQVLCRTLVEKHHNVIKLDLSPVTSAIMMATDHGRLLQILLNLLSNAAKFTKDGVITLGARHDEDRAWVRLFVADTGEGIAKSEHERIFESFAQTSSKTFAQYKGTGLGLAIVKQLARLMGGHVSLESAPGKGSTFSLHLPIEHPDFLAKSANAKDLLE